MDVFEIKCEVEVLQDIPMREVMMRTASLIDNYIVSAEGGKYANFHSQKRFKNYVFDGLFPLEEDKVYKAGCAYTFKVRTVDPFFGDFLMKHLGGASGKKSPFMAPHSVEGKPLGIGRIEKLYSITPLIIKINDPEGNKKGRYWRSPGEENVSKEYLLDRICKNLIKKYEVWNKGEEVGLKEIFKGIEVINKTPIKTLYKKAGSQKDIEKDIFLLGDKVELLVNGDHESQKIAFFALGCGIGEMNSRGFGFVNKK